MATSTLTRSFSSIYFSHLINSRVLAPDGSRVGLLKDLIAHNEERPRVFACQVKVPGKGVQTFAWDGFAINVEDHNYQIICKEAKEITPPSEAISVNRHILDKQLVDINDKKLVRVNDVRLAFLSSGAFLVAVDVGLSGLLRRLGVVETVNSVLHVFNRAVPGRLILWSDIGILSEQSRNIKLSVTYSKLNMLHPSDLSDIIEELDVKTRAAVFDSLDHEKAADVLEEMEDIAKISLVEDLPVEKAADVLEKMPTDEVADILDDLNEEKAEELLNEMDKATSTEIRELMEYPDDTAGSLMTTDFLSFTEDTTPEVILGELRRLKPESDMVYSIYVVDKHNHLMGVVSLRDLVVAELHVPLSQWMNRNPVSIIDVDNIRSLTKLVSKYSLLAVPVVTKDRNLLGTIVIDDIVYRMIRSKKARL